MTRAVEAARRFWFREVRIPSRSSRIAYAVVVLAWTILSGAGAVLVLRGRRDPRSRVGLGAWRSPARLRDRAVTALYLLLLVGALCLLFGFKTRLAAVVVFVCLVSFARQDPWV